MSSWQSALAVGLWCTRYLSTRNSLFRQRSRFAQHRLSRASTLSLTHSGRYYNPILMLTLECKRVLCFWPERYLLRTLTPNRILLGFFFWGGEGKRLLQNAAGAICLFAANDGFLAPPCKTRGTTRLVLYPADGCLTTDTSRQQKTATRNCTRSIRTMNSKKIIIGGEKKTTVSPTTYRRHNELHAWTKPTHSPTQPTDEGSSYG